MVLREEATESRAACSGGLGVVLRVAQVSDIFVGAKYGGICWTEDFFNFVSPLLECLLDTALERRIEGG